MLVDNPRIFPFFIAGLAVLLMYRRLRRSFGRQTLRPVRMYLRIAILLMLGCSLLPAAFRSGQFPGAEVLSLMTGLALGAWGAQRTRYQMYDGQLHYIPHTYTGIAVSLLFVGRLVYRFVQLYSMNHGTPQGDATMQQFGSPEMMRSPMTAAFLFLVVGYYVFYYSAVLWKSKRISPEDLEVQTSMPVSQEREGAASG